MDKKLVIDVVKQIRKLADSIEALVEEDKKPTKSKGKDISLEDVRAVLAKLSQHGKTADVKELIVKYGGTKLSDIDESKYGDLLKDAEDIKID